MLSTSFFGNRQFIRKLHIPSPLPYDITEGIDPLFDVDNFAEICNYRAMLIEKLNSLVSDTEFQNDNTYRIIMRTAQIPSHALLFNYASQSWNLDFFLQSLKSNDNENKKNYDNNINKILNMKIADEFRSFDLFKEHFTNMALAIFGSGWTWLVKTEYDTLCVVNTYNAEDPNNHPSRFNKKSDKDDINQKQDTLTPSNQPLPPPLIKLSMELPHNSRLTPLLCLNVWEHAYVKQYGILNKSLYIENFWKCINWEVINNRFGDVSS
ncbi:14114_t:CDS:2 [Entrophospora sp. SA101]|nr:14114_t:CDS:2 [Entrophospora sp. SA101]